jgi:4'-phosphopantetheinyl transferase EntD
MQHKPSIDTQTVCDAWRSLLPSSVDVVAGPIRTDAPALTTLESLSAGNVGPGRLHELRTGRDYAKRALSRFGFQNVQLPIDVDRYPVWPRGAIGSITHTGDATKNHCAVAVALSAEIHAIGIDIESDVVLHPDVWTTVLTRYELTQLSTVRMVDRERDVLSRWCVKEAIAKASRSILDPTRIETVKLDTCATDYIGITESYRWLARTVRVDGFVLAAVTVPQQ